MLIAAVITITLALILYTIGVWGEKLSGGLKPWNITLFWAGLLFDTTGTTLMSLLSNNPEANLHTATGLLALLLMLFHALWATAVLKKGNARLINVFHRFSIAVWAVWLIPFGSGLILNMF